MAVNGAGNGGGKGGSIRAGRAYVELSANDDGLRAALAKARAMVLKFGKVLAIGAGAAGAGLFGALAIGAKNLINKGTDLSRLGDKLGVPVDQLSAFAYAADTTGQSLEDLSGHFENLAERVAQGANGAGEAAETFKKLGLDASQLKLKNPVDQLIAIADAMQSVTNETDRLGMLSSIGGDQFQNLNSLFKQGPQGIAALMKEARDVGAVMSNDTAASSMRASMAFTRSSAAIKGAIYGVIEAVLPSADTFETISRVVIFMAKAIRQGLNSVVASVAGATGQLTLLKDVWQGISDAVKAGDMRLAFEIASKGIQIIWKDLLLSLTRGWQSFLQSFASGFSRILSAIASVVPSQDLQNAVAQLGQYAGAGAGAVGADRIAAFTVERNALRGELSALMAQARQGAGALPQMANGVGASQIARFLGGVRGTFGAPDYRQFFGPSGGGVEQKQLDTQKKIAAGIELLNKKATPLVFE